jgi:hypothetical protein
MMKIVGKDHIARFYLSSSAKTHKTFTEGLYKLAPSSEKKRHWAYAVNDTFDHILSSRLAGMPEDRATWTGKDAQLNTLMNKLTMIHKSMPEPTPPNPDRPETLEAAYERIDQLQKKITEMTTQLTASKEKAKGAALMSLWNSGCEDLCYHFGHCSDVMGDCWEPMYEKDGLEGLKTHLRILSKDHHKNNTCKDCTRWIDSLYD